MILTSGRNYTTVVTPILDALNDLFGPLMTIVTAVGVIYCIILGVKYATASEPQEHQKAIDAIKNAILGITLAFILMVAINLLIGPLINWVNMNAGTLIFGT